MNTLCQTFVKCQKVALAEVICSLKIIICNAMIIIFIFIYIQHLRNELIFILIIIQLIQFIPMRHIIPLWMLTIIRKHIHTLIIEPIIIIIFSILRRAWYQTWLVYIIIRLIKFKIFILIYVQVNLCGNTVQIMWFVYLVVSRVRMRGCWVDGPVRSRFGVVGVWVGFTD